MLVSVLMAQKLWQGEIAVALDATWGTLKHPPRGSCCQDNTWQLERLFGHNSENDKARPLNCCVFSALCNDMGSDYVMLLQHTEVCWLSRGKVMTHFFYLRDELKVFFTDHNFHLSVHLHDDEFLRRMAYLGHVFSRLNNLNLGLQGLSATIFNMQDQTEAMIRKLELFSVCINKDNTQVYPSLYYFFVCKWT